MTVMHSHTENHCPGLHEAKNFGCFFYDNLKARSREVTEALAVSISSALSSLCEIMEENKTKYYFPQVKLSMAFSTVAFISLSRYW